MGRYTLQQLTAVVESEHEIFAFYQRAAVPPTLSPDLLARENLHLVQLDFPEAGLLDEHRRFTREGERAYTAAVQRFVEPYHLDLFHITCFDDTSYYTPRDWTISPFVMTVYDLIPLYMADVFLTDPHRRASYLDGLALMRRADALIAISETTRRVVVQQLAVPAERVFVAPPYASAEFRPAGPDDDIPEVVRSIGGDYIYTVTSFEEHKNLRRLLQAYAAALQTSPRDVRLAISAGSAPSETPPDVNELTDSLGITSRIVWLPRLSEAEIVALYQHARACAHVSLLEGFGLPIVEAMQSGTPVLTSNRGVMQDVAGTAAVLVDPENIDDIARGLVSVLTDDALRQQLREAGFAQLARFTPTQLGEQTVAAYEYTAHRRLRVAMWSPLPPARSGISDYTAELIPSLARHVDLVVYTNPGVDPALFSGLPVTLRTYADYPLYRTELVDLHVYHMGNNAQFHEEIYEQLLRVPGVVILHDLTLYFFYNSLSHKYPDRYPLADEVAYSEGNEAARMLDHYRREWSDIAKWDTTKLPMMRRIAEASLLVVTHTPHTRDVLQPKYPAGRYTVLPLATALSERPVQVQAAPAPVVTLGAFGGIHPVKRLHVILDAFNRVASRHAGLTFRIVGRVDDPGYLDTLHAFISEHQLTDRVEIRTDVPISDFVQNIETTDVVINLRWPTSGEMSATAMRALGAGKPVIVSDIPQFRHLDSRFVWRVPVDAGEVDALEALFLRAVQEPAWVHAAGDAAYRFAQEQLSFDVVSEQYHALFRTVTPKARALAYQPPIGVNILGDLKGDTGLGEIARSIVRTFGIVGVPTAYHETVVDPVVRTSHVDSLPRGQHYDINMLHVNAPFLWELVNHHGYDQYLKTRYNIAYWFYELPDFPPNWGMVCDVLDEIWVATEFVRESIQRVTTTPVYVLPAPIQVGEHITASRSTFGIPDDRYTFLFSFNPGSSAARKNPFGLFDAYERAFGDQADKPLLVLKGQALNAFPELAAELRRRAAELGVLLLEQNLSRDEMYTLIASCDCYISLHRSEGWGLGMAEAMALGKPVIGTGWSGNIDFMSHENSYLVDYTLVPISAEHHRFQDSYLTVYVPGSSIWAEPDIDHAASLMRHVVAHPDDAAARGRRAASTIRHEFNAAVLGERMRLRLHAIKTSTGKYIATSEQQNAGDTGQREAHSSVPHIIPHTGGRMDHLRQTVAAWNAERNRTTIRGFGQTLNRIPGLGFVFRTLIRIRNLGKVWGAEAYVFDALLQHLDTLNAQVAARSLNQVGDDLGRVRQNVDLIRDQLTRQPVTSVEGRDLVERTIIEMQTVIERLRQQLNRADDDVRLLRETAVQLQQKHTVAQRSIEQLEQQYSILDEQTRLNTSQLRRLNFEAAAVEDDTVALPILDIVHWMEAYLPHAPELRLAMKVDFTIHGKIDEAQMLALGEHLKGRISNHFPLVWYHFDVKPEELTQAFFDNFRLKLQPDALLVLVTRDAQDTETQPDGFVRVRSHQFTKLGTRAFISILRRSADERPVEG